MDPLLQLVVTALTGGAAGSIITAIVGSRRQRKQLVRYFAYATPLIQGSALPTDRRWRLVAEGDEDRYEYKNPFVIEVTVENKGAQDWPSFSITVDIPDGFQIIDFSYVPPTSSHAAKCEPKPALATPSGEATVTLNPLNRGDRFRLRLLAEAPFETDEYERINVSTAHPVRLVRD